jgi:membrane protein
MASLTTKQGGADASKDQDGSDDRGRSAAKPTEVSPRGWLDVLKRVRAEMKENNTQLLAAGVAFWAFTSLFPALIAAITVYGLVVEPEEVARRVEDLAGSLPAEARSLLEEQLSGITTSSGSALGFGLLVSIFTAIWAASGGMGNMMNAVNAVYEESDDRNWFTKKGIALLLTVGAIAMLGVAVAGIAIWPAILEGLGVGGFLKGLLSLAIWPVLGLLFVVGLSVLYRLSPDRDDAEWKWVTPGAIGATVLWVVASLVFQFYTANFGSYNETYGALAAVVLLLLWLMITCLCVLLGAHINAELEAQTAHDTTVEDDRPMGQRDAYKADTLGEVGEGGKKKDKKQIDLRKEHAR